jgi:hypothetical protein
MIYGAYVATTKIGPKKKFEFCSYQNSLKEIFEVCHYEELVKTIETDILFTVFGALNTKILIFQIKKRKTNVTGQQHTWSEQ